MAAEENRPHYGEVFARTKSGEDVFLTDQSNQFIDDLVEGANSGSGDIVIDMGERMTGTAVLNLGSRV